MNLIVTLFQYSGKKNLLVPTKTPRILKTNFQFSAAGLLKYL